MILFCSTATATTEIYTLSLHDALPIWCERDAGAADHPHLGGARDGFRERGERHGRSAQPGAGVEAGSNDGSRSEEHTSELQSQSNLVCRLLLEKKKTTLCPSR